MVAKFNVKEIKMLNRINLFSSEAKKTLSQYNNQKSLLYLPASILSNWALISCRYMTSGIEDNKVNEQSKLNSNVQYDKTTNDSRGYSRNSTVNEAEIAKFSRLEKSWWNEKGEMIALHTMNKLRVPFIRDNLLTYSKEREISAKSLRGLKIIDIGCGGGILSEPLARLGAQVTGLDASQTNINVACWHMNKDKELSGRIEYVCNTIEELGISRAGTYDAVVASEVIEHVDNVPQFVSSCVQIIKPGGSLFFTTLNKTWISYIVAIISAEKIFRFVPVGTHDWNKFIPPSELENKLNTNECDVRQLLGLSLNPFTLQWSWTSNTSISYALHAVKRANSSNA